MTVDVDIVNRALLEVGAQATVSSIAPSDGSTEGNAAAVLYAPTRDALLRSALWGFARKQVILTQLKSALDTNPTIPQPWAYEYAYPSDCLRVRFVAAFQPSASTTPPLMTNMGSAFIPLGANGIRGVYQVASDVDSSNIPVRVILTNLAQAQMVYTTQLLSPDLWDVQFQEALVASLAAKFANTLTRNTALRSEQVKLAEQIIMQARVSDGDEGTKTIDHLPDWLRMRGMGGSDLGGVFAGGMADLGFDNFSWPWGGGL